MVLSQSRSPRGYLWLAGFVLLLTGCPGQPTAPPAPPTVIPAAPAAREPQALSPSDCDQLASLRNLAVGALENEKLREAERNLDELESRLVDNRLVLRNRAVSRLMGLQSGTITAEQAQSAATALLKAQPVAPDYWLAARIGFAVAEKQTDPAARDTALNLAIEWLRQAQQLHPQRAAIPWELYEATRYGSAAQVTLARAALADAARIAPDNLFVLTEQMLQQADARDAALADSLRTLQRLSGPLRDGVQRRARVDLHDLIQKGLTAIEAGQWPQATGSIRTINAVIRPEDRAQSDRRQLVPHPLEFVLHDFQPPLCESAPASQSPLPISFASQTVAIDLATVGEIREINTADFNLDGLPDLWILGSQSLEIWSRTEPTADWSRAISLPLGENYAGLIVADFDRDTIKGSAQPAAGVCHDADADVMLYGPAGVAVYRNDLTDEGTRQFIPVEQASGLGAVKEVSVAIPGDFDHDGDLDLALWTPQGLQMWPQTGALEFANATDRVQQAETAIPGAHLIAVDWERDVDLDVVVCGGQKLGYFENLRHGEFRWQPFEEAFQGLSASLGCSLAELDGNVSWDLVLSGPQGVQAFLTRTVPAESVTFKMLRSIVNDSAVRHITGDWNNDGWVDVLVVDESGLQVHAGQQGGTWSLVTTRPDAGFMPQNLKTADLDLDGRLDVVACGSGQITILQNTSASAPGWLAVRVRGDEDPQSGRVNQYGIGSLVEVRTGDHYQAQVITGQVTHFGLGASEQADSLRVLWTNGVPQVTLQPARNQSLCERLALKGSCPYLYTWNGERFEFYTDLLWAAPLGLQFAEGVLAPSRAWEYLLVSGNALKEQNGHYHLRVTEELWEAAYFDQIELLAIDHPAEVEVFSNEKVGPPDIAAMQVHTVRQRLHPIAARDQRGRDVGELLREIDDRYVRAFDVEYRQGLTEPHFIELDLGELKQPQKITLFLTGWIYPTDTSLNVALSQDPHLEGPRPPTLSVPDAAGNWQVVRPFLGFPGGKTKTIAVDVSTAFLTDDYRLRIETTHEIYWDAAFFTLDEEPAKVRVTPLKLTAADLHYRGFSAAIPPGEHAPERYDYGQVAVAPKWPPMLGKFTRYGDVLELLTNLDDRLVVFGSGDEISLSFSMPEKPLPAGWRRDFFLHNVGWDKDADLHTIYGQMVEPLPYFAMPGYPYRDETGPTETPEYAEYLRKYQTREGRKAHYWQLRQEAVRSRSELSP